jgi:hypothetical protein
LLTLAGYYDVALSDFRLAAGRADAGPVGRPADPARLATLFPADDFLRRNGFPACLTEPPVATPEPCAVVAHK